MPKMIKPLNDKELRNAKPKDKQYKLYDGQGLIFLVFPDGRKRWRLDYTFNKKRNTLSLGAYPEVSLKEARDEKNKVRKQIKAGENPARKFNIDVAKYTFEELAYEYFNNRIEVSEGYKKKSLGRLKKDIFPHLQNTPIDSIKPLEMLYLIQQIEARGTIYSAKKVFQVVRAIYKYAVTIGKAKVNILEGIDSKVAFKASPSKNYQHTTNTNELKEILLAIDNYNGEYSTLVALQLLPYLFVRPYTIRAMEWSEVSFIDKLWIIPSEKMKMRKEHIVPLSGTIISILKSIQTNTFITKGLVFPSRKGGIMSENTLNYAFKRMGFNVTSHGFRHTASTILHENIHNHNIPSDVIELQLAHTPQGVKGVYNKALYLPERIKLMNWYSDYLDALKLL